MPHLIPKELCTRCGACFAADSKGLLLKDSQGFPVHDSDDFEYVDGLLRVCSGENWNYKELLKQQYGDDVKYDPGSPDIGQHLKIFLLSSSDTVWRDAGQSGGVTSTLLRFSFDSGKIDSALAVRRPNSEKGNPFSSEPYIARSSEELADSFGSKYTICSSLEAISTLAKESNAFAATLLPCQTVGLKRLANDWDVSLKEKCKLIIGPYCGLNMETEVGEAIANAAGVEAGDVFAFRNRGGRFPGETTLETKEGKEVYLDRTAHRILYRMHTPSRCYTCTDYGNELADISVADCWEMNKEGFRFPDGAAYVICRTERGLASVEDAIRAGYLLSHEVDGAAAQKRWRASFYHRKVRAHNRIRYWKRHGKPVPKPDYEMPPVFKESRISDFIEIWTWRLFRSKNLRKNGLRFWLWLAKAKVGSFRNLIFEDCKRYLFTHTYDQFNLRMYKHSVSNYLKWVKRGFTAKSRSK
jgi:coenzyme F420-reducing hydrogenase beta subunit